MPDMANITVKKSDGTTDVIYTKLSPSAGDGVPAIWKNQTVGISPGQQPELRVRAGGKSTKGVPQRVVNGSYKYPKAVSNTTTGEITLTDGITITFSAVVNQTMVTAELREGVFQSTNLIASALIKSVLESGYAPN